MEANKIIHEEYAIQRNVLEDRIKRLNSEKLDIAKKHREQIEVAKAKYQKLLDEQRDAFEKRIAHLESGKLAAEKVLVEKTIAFDEMSAKVLEDSQAEKSGLIQRIDELKARLKSEKLETAKQHREQLNAVKAKHQQSLDQMRAKIIQDGQAEKQGLVQRVEELNGLADLQRKENALLVDELKAERAEKEERIENLVRSNEKKIETCKRIMNERNHYMKLAGQNKENGQPEAESQNNQQNRPSDASEIVRLIKETEMKDEKIFILSTKVRGLERAVASYSNLVNTDHNYSRAPPQPFRR